MTDTKHPQNKKANQGDTVYFRFGKSGAANLEKVREMTESKRCTMANVMREMIGRGLADWEAEQAVIAAHKKGGAVAVAGR